MSYCVNCGVELESSSEKCPLCHTPVINPNELIQMERVSSYPKEKGQVEVVKRKDFGIFLSVVLGATAASCALLNLLVFNHSMWSLLIIGICIILFVLAIPAVIYTKLPIYLSLLFDGIAVGVYLYMIAYLTPSDEWFWRLALPIVALITLLVELFTLLIRAFPVSFVTTALYIFVGTAVLCVGIELLIDRFLYRSLGLSWSAVVLTACGVIVIALITLLSKRRLRDEVRRRLHF